MRSKKTSADELICALKQLKLYDRRSRRSMGNRSASYRGWNHVCTFRPLLCYPKATDSLPNQLDTSHACEYCVLNYQPSIASYGDIAANTTVATSPSGRVSSLLLPNHDTYSRRSDFSPFSASTDIRSTLPMNPEGIASNLTDENIRLQSFSSIELRWPSDTGSNSFIHESTARPVSVGGNTFSSTFYTTRHHCCLHPCVSSVPPTNHMRLYRRLYSLIDHPCVSVYRTLCKSHLSEVSAPPVFNRVQLSKHWDLSLPNPNANICQLRGSHSMTLDTTSEAMSGEIAASVSDSTQSTSQQLCTNFSASTVTNPMISSAQFHSTQCDDGSHGLLAFRRTRRNSDPQHWQQNRAEESDGTADERGRCNRLSLSYFCRNLPASDQQSKLVTCPNPAEPTGSSNSAFQSNESNYPQSYKVSANQQSVGETDSQSNLFTVGHATAPRSMFAPTSSPPSLVRPSCLHMPDPARIDDPEDCTPSGDTTPQPLPDFMPKLFKPPSLSRGHFRVASAGGDNNELGSELRSLEQELSLIEGADSEPGSNVPDTSRPLLTDVSVNELASYMEHMVHIPGRMSEMAQRMYL